MNRYKMKGLLARAAAPLAAAAILAAWPAGHGARASEGAEIHRQSWTFGGVLGSYDQKQLRRGYQVYKTVCATCHGLKLLSYRNLGQPNGPEYAEEDVRKYAAEAKVPDIDDAGKAIERPGRPSDRFVSPYKNEAEAAAMFNGAAPPDLSVIAKARGVHRDVAWFTEPGYWLSDIVTGYEEKGVDYVYALLTGYAEPPAEKTLPPGASYNRIFPGNQIAMPAPLSDGVVDYDDGTPATLDNYARDVAAFLAWASEPTLTERKRMGAKVFLYLIVLVGVLYLSKRAAWRGVKH
jgi:ubiquinol-cytochrome c reductase cytochrome c1 subunit